MSLYAVYCYFLIMHVCLLYASAVCSGSNPFNSVNLKEETSPSHLNLNRLLIFLYYLGL